MESLKKTNSAPIKILQFIILSSLAIPLAFPLSLESLYHILGVKIVQSSCHDCIFKFNMCKYHKYLPQYIEECERNPIATAKPVIYLYPNKQDKIIVKLSYKGNIDITYPEYQNGWNVTAYPNGKIIDNKDGKEYSYLFWDGYDENATYNLTKGFIVEGAKTAPFLQEKLQLLGLKASEYNEFIVYWLPKMQHNKYNLIHFATREEYEDRAALTITPKPDALLRVFMVFKSIDESISIPSQELKQFERKGFTAVEWGGSDISETTSQNSTSYIN